MGQPANSSSAITTTTASSSSTSSPSTTPSSASVGRLPNLKIEVKNDNNSTTSFDLSSPLSATVVAARQAQAMLDLQAARAHGKFNGLSPASNSDDDSSPRHRVG